MPEDIRSTRTPKAKTLVEGAARIAQATEEMTKPPIETGFRGQGKCQSEERFRSNTGRVATALNVDEVPDTAAHNTAQHEQAPQGAPVTGAGVEPDPSATGTRGAGGRAEAQQLRRADRLEPTPEGVPLHRVDERRPTSKSPQGVPQAEQVGIARTMSGSMNARLPHIRIDARRVTRRVPRRLRSIPARKGSLPRVS